MQFEIVQIRNRQIEAIRDARNGEYSIPFRPVCDRLNLAFSAQLRRLKRHHWATVSITDTVAEDGKPREMATVDRKTFVMWLATIESSRIKDESARSTIELYQSEAVEALDRHFFGDRPAAVPALNEPRLAALESALGLAAKQMRDMQDSVRETQTDNDQLRRLVALMDSRVANAEQAMWGSTGYRTLGPWARERGIKLSSPESNREGRVCDKLSAAAGLMPAPYRRGDGKFVNMYHLSVLETWYQGYLRRQNQRPSLFSPEGAAS